MVASVLLFGKPIRSLVWLLVAGACALTAQPIPPALRELSRAYQESGSATDRAKLAQYAETAPSGIQGLVHLALAAGDREAEQWDAAARELHKAAEPETGLADYVDYYRAHSLARAERHEDAAWVLRSYEKRHPSSRLVPSANRLRAESLIRANALPQAQRLLEDKGASFSEPVRLYLLGRVLEENGELQAAIRSYRRVYYFWPFSDQADVSEQRLDGLRAKLGKRYPDAPAEWRLARGDALFKGRSYTKAASEYARAWPGVAGADQERAKVRLGSAQYRALQTTAADQWLRTVQVKDPELQAERLYFLGECARRKGRLTAFRQRAEELASKHPKSPWTEEAFFSVGNSYLLQNDENASRRWYERAARSFPKGKYAEKAHWKVCWRAFLDGDPRARALFEEHAKLYPGSGQTSAAMYWLGRILEQSGEPDAAQGLYAAIREHFPHYYYSFLASKRTKPSVSGSGEPLVNEITAKLPAHRQLTDTAGQRHELLLGRGRLLFALGMDEDARRELYEGDYRKPDGHLIGLELARQSAERGDHFQAMRYMKRFGFGYLRIPVSKQSREFWERLYPLPFEDRLRARAQPHELDPYLVAGLIRQESEFNPRAVSRAGARGLMQVMPATGRALARRLGVPRFSTGRLFEPDISLRFGTYHLKEVIDQFNGEIELALAAYNAGATRAKTWITWEEFPEPAAFVETIPFTETRGYVQAVLRNRETYRKIYDGSAMRTTTPSRDRIAGEE